MLLNEYYQKGNNIFKRTAEVICEGKTVKIIDGWKSPEKIEEKDFLIQYNKDIFSYANFYGIKERKERMFENGPIYYLEDGTRVVYLERKGNFVKITINPLQITLGLLLLIPLIGLTILSIIQAVNIVLKHIFM